MMLLGSMAGRRLAWRGIAYQVGRRGQVEAVWRAEAPDGLEAPGTPPPAQEAPAAADPDEGPVILPLPNRDPEVDSTAATNRRRRSA
jgi:hypothetical protein